MRKLLVCFALIVFFLSGFADKSAQAAEDKGATAYLNDIAAQALKLNGSDRERVEFWRNLFRTQWDFPYLIAHAFNQKSQLLTDKDREDVREWAVMYAMGSDSKFINELVKKSVPRAFDVGSCEVSGATCSSRIRIKLKYDQPDMQFVVQVIRRGDQYFVNEIVYTAANVTVRDQLVAALKSAHGNGEVKLQLAAKPK
jgi:hypothetical protein